ncbi:MAG: hypothetical protein JO331_13960 [Verrucomicrobia bacterium]|nr:hypothetical protein [Verrucomicrobiota bacterium]
MGKTLGSGNDAQDESNQDLPRIVVIGAFWLVGAWFASCSTGPIRPKNSIKTANPPKGVTARSVSQILIFPPPKGA